jgi:hypothetical protein
VSRSIARAIFSRPAKYDLEHNLGAWFHTSGGRDERENELGRLAT